MRDTGASGFTFAFDEIKIYDASCGNIDNCLEWKDLIDLFMYINR